jgi:divalent metal cation (Fe/Co/Zn/Cd) transporter
MLRGAMGDILDKQESSEITGHIRALTLNVPGVTSVEKCRVRKSGLNRLVDIHVRVSGERTVREGHEIAHLVKDILLASPLHLGDVTVHIEPEELACAYPPVRE